MTFIMLSFSVQCLEMGLSFSPQDTTIKLQVCMHYNTYKFILEVVKSWRFKGEKIKNVHRVTFSFLKTKPEEGDYHNIHIRQGEIPF